MIYIPITAKLLGIFFDSRKTSYGFLLFSILPFSLIAAVWFSIFQSRDINPILSLAIEIVILMTGFFVVTYNYKSTLAKRFIVTASLFILWVIVNIIADIFVAVLITFERFGGEQLILQALMIPLIGLGAALLFERFKYIKKTSYYPRATTLIILILISMPIIAVFLINIVGIGLIDGYRYGSAFIIFMLTVFIFLIFYLYDTLSSNYEAKIKSELQAQEKEYYYAQCQLMQESVENINAIHHDMKLHLAAARDFITNNKSDEAAKYLDGLLGDVEKNIIYSNTKNTAFDSIINYKLKNAGQENIKLDLRLLIPPFLNIEAADIVIIIGNLLDNALDAVSKVEEKFIKLDIECSRESLFIHIENTFDGVVKYAEEADGKGKQIITKKTGGEHGHGLKNIRKSVEKYNGHFETGHEDNIFIVTVLLYMNS
jgi:hypothetical protein